MIVEDGKKVKDHGIIGVSGEERWKARQEAKKSYAVRRMFGELQCRHHNRVYN